MQNIYLEIAGSSTSALILEHYIYLCVASGLRSIATTDNKTSSYFSGLNKRQVCYARKQLEKKGLIQCEIQKGNWERCTHTLISLTPYLEAQLKRLS